MSIFPPLLQHHAATKLRHLPHGGHWKIIFLCLLLVVLPQFSLAAGSSSSVATLQQIKQRGVLRHLGITYAHFVIKTKTGFTGLDVELMQLFAKHLGVEYKFVTTTWNEIFTNLTGRKMKQGTNEFYPESTEEIKGDLIANGLTILPWRQKIVDYTLPTFPTGVWLISKAKSELSPIKPSGNITEDIHKVNNLLKGHSVLTVEHTCLDPRMFKFTDSDIDIIKFKASNSLDQLVPSILEGAAEATVLDIPDALIALQKYPGEIISLGPVTKTQLMAVAIPKESPELRAEFNVFFQKLWQDGTYKELVEKYYPSVFLYFGDFFSKPHP